jgi:hypothetical protein
VGFQGQRLADSGDGAAGQQLAFVQRAGAQVREELLLAAGEGLDPGGQLVQQVADPLGEGAVAPRLVRDEDGRGSVPASVTPALPHARPQRLRLRRRVHHHAAGEAAGRDHQGLPRQPR